MNVTDPKGGEAVAIGELARFMRHIEQRIDLTTAKPRIGIYESAASNF